MHFLMHTIGAFALALMALGILPACDPARDGHFYEDGPEPVKMNGAVGAPGGSLYRPRNVRRWFGATKNSSQLYPTNVVQASSFDLYPWSYGYVSGDSEEYLEYGVKGTAAMELRTVQGVPDYVYVTSFRDDSVQPVGPWGPTLWFPAGYHVLRRSCSADDPNQFAEVSLSTELNYDANAAASLALGRDPFLERCGITIPVQAEFGDKVAMVPLSTTEHREPIADMVWAPDSRTVYLVGGDPSKPVANTAIWSLDTTSLEISQLLAGNFYAPLQVAARGSSLLINHIVFAQGSTGYAGQPVAYEIDRQPLVGPSLLPTRVFAGSASNLGWTAWWTMSPDGRTVASSDDRYLPTSVVLMDLVSGSIRTIAVPGFYPLAWNPTGESLLVADSKGSSPMILSLDGTLTALPAGPGIPKLGFSPGDSVQHLPFWSSSGPRFALQDWVGTRVYDYAKQVWFSLVEANRVARPGASLKAVAGTDQVFAWAIQCWGLGETSCVSELRRLTVATGKVDVVARANDALQFAVSPDGTRIVFAQGADLYLKAIAP